MEFFLFKAVLLKYRYPLDSVI